jgi:hypothetical protein
VLGSVLGQHTEHFVYKFVLLPGTLLDLGEDIFLPDSFETTALEAAYLWQKVLKSGIRFS